MSQEPVETVREIFDAFNSGDIERIIAFMDPDVEAEVPSELSAEPDTYRGHEGMRRYFESFEDALDEIRFKPERFWHMGESVVVDARLLAKGRLTAIAVEQRHAQVWAIRDGKALRVRAYASLSDALESVGLAG
jgi:ketosteroid isomerase-like protein